VEEIDPGRRESRATEGETEMSNVSKIREWAKKGLKELDEKVRQVNATRSARQPKTDTKH
jgi:hypothetical protein